MTAEELARESTYSNRTAVLTPAHCEYLVRRHGTVELDPLPSPSPEDPYNWPKWKKISNLFLVAFHALMGTFTASSIIPAFLDIAADLGVSIHRASYLTSLQIAVLGGAPLFWRPLAHRYGRRPILLLSLVGSLICNIGCARSPTFGSMAACRALVAFFISPAGAIGSAVVAECFFKHERAMYMGVWTLLITVGIPLSPFLFGFVIQHAGYRWVYWILSMINGAQLLLYIPFGPETRYTGPAEKTLNSGSHSVMRAYFTFCRVDPTPLTVWEFIQPLSLVSRVSVLIPAIAYAMVFLFGCVMNTVEIPQLLQQKFKLSAQGLGLQFLALIVGSVLGEQIGGPLSDQWMRRRQQQMKKSHVNGETHVAPEPEYRLWLSYPGYLVTIAGMVVFLVQTEQSPAGRWNIMPVLGAAIGSVGNQIITTVLITYAVDTNYEQAASVGVFITFVRQMWGFIGPFWFTEMFDSVGVANSSGIVVGLIIVGSFLPTVLLQWRGEVWRRARQQTRLQVD